MGEALFIPAAISAAANLLEEFANELRESCDLDGRAWACPDCDGQCSARVSYEGTILVVAQLRTLHAAAPIRVREGLDDDVCTGPGAVQALVGRTEADDRRAEFESRTGEVS